ncbi:SPOR domain-containing protein [Sphingopyxis sp.]|uniref:SPOR domain-containing protein n=1 Tax=Sphingopyxis sp. TaxID=1908224 RepID=UPI00260B1A59|nr:SPOR domain-containing protein [Sphingopyxis sp.]MCW0199731.1 SPOR domain-containing protein [Sphingopyxis sp.]
MPSFRAAAFLALPLLALAAPAHADVKSGVEAWQAGDYQQAVAEWRPLAVAGDADAEFNLGQAYKLGRGVPADLGQAESWYRRAAKQGHLQAEDNLGLILFTANKRDEAMPYIKASAARGEPRAQYVLGTAMFNGDYATKDWPRAYALTKRASDAGLGIASARLVQLDNLIPLDQRQAGLAMLPQIEKDEARARLAAVNAAAPEPAKPAPSPIRTASLPVSTPGATYTPPPVIAPAKPAPALSTPAAVAAATAASEATAAATAAKGGAPGTTYAAPPESGKLPPKPEPKPEPKPAPKPAKAAVAVHTGTSPWRAQFGAFGVEANARGLWKSLEKSYSALAGRTPVYAKAGAVTRLQTAGFASKADAESLCAAVRKGGQACLVVSQ